MPKLPVTLANLPLRPSTLVRFKKRGFESTTDIEESKRSGGISNLAAELGCSLSEASSLAREVESAISAISTCNRDSWQGGSGMTAASLLSSLPESRRGIITFCRSIDKLLGDGINLSELTEIAGVPGVGKTQLAIQICVDASLPNEYGGPKGEAVYIDCEGSFSPERCESMAQGLSSHIASKAEKRNQRFPQGFQAHDILDGIHVFRVHDEAAQVATIYSLPNFLRERADKGTPVKVVVVDSIAFHYRCAPPGSDYMARTRSLSAIAASLTELAVKFNVAVVAINQMTTKVGASISDKSDGNHSRLMPALGESWSHATTTRILLSHTGDEVVRKCCLVKSPHKASGEALFQVTEKGIRDIPRGDFDGSTNSNKRKWAS